MNVNSVQVGGQYEAIAANYTNSQIRQQGAMALNLIESAGSVDDAQMSAPPADGPKGQNIDLQV